MRTVVNSNNIIHVLKQLWVEPGISRIEISKRLGLDKSTVTIIVNRLDQLNLIEETEATSQHQNGGRRPIGLKVREKTGVILGLEIQTDYYSADLVDLTGQVLYQTRGIIAEGSTLIDSFLSIYKQMYLQAEKMRLPLLAIGLGIAATVNPYSGIIRHSNPLGIHEPLSFYDEIKAFVHVPVFIDNDANCGCWAELSNRSRKRDNDFLLILGEIRKNMSSPESPRLLAVGMGIVMNERVRYGKEFSAGEYKSPSWLPNTLGQFSHSTERLHRMQTDQEIIDYVKPELCRDAAFIVNMLCLDRVVIGGDVIRYYDQLKSTLETEIEKNKNYPRDEEVVIDSSRFGESVVSYGAAAMVLEHCFLTYDTPSENPWQQTVGIDLIYNFHSRIK